MFFRYPHIVIFLLGFSVQAQTDSLKIESDSVKSLYLKEVSINHQLDVFFTQAKFVFRKEDVEELQPTDLGDILQKSSASNIKSYGGLGGLKTISVKGLGSHHVGVVKDGFAIHSTQTGQVNLAQIHVDEIDILYNSDFSYNLLQIPVSAVTQGNYIGLVTNLGHGGLQKVETRASMRAGSYGLLDGYASMKFNADKLYVGVYGKLREAKNNYPFTLSNINNLEEQQRTNNNYQDANYGFAIGSGRNSESKVKFRLLYNGMNINQQLPGAVILYNNTADERLATDNHMVNFDAISSIKSVDFRWYSSYNNNHIVYTDPSYLNQSGVLTATYNNQLINTGMVLSSLIREKWQINGGMEQAYSQLRNEEGNLNDPNRWHLQSYAAAGFERKDYSFNLQLSGQYVKDQTTDTTKNWYGMNPRLLYRINSSKKMLYTHEIELLSTMRMPSFNELYYNNIGNVQLNPERTEQFTYTSFLSPSKATWFNLKYQLYTNQIRDKIVAIPTKNLFTWSMQNVGRVFTGGGAVEVRMLKKWSSSNMEITGNYTYQKSVDITNKNDPTYLHQIAYTPEHTANFDLCYKWKGMGARISNQFISYRYVLNENVNANLIDGFVTTDFALFYAKKVNVSQFKFQFTVKNVFNQYYSIIRSYVMPGRNFLISCSYALH